MLTCECLHCGTVSQKEVSYDELGWHTSCDACESSFDVDVIGDYLVSIWNCDSKYAIDDWPSHGELVEQFAFYKSKTMDECQELNQKLSEFEGYVYELYEVDSGKQIALGVFSQESLYDDIWYADEHIHEEGQDKDFCMEELT